MKSLFLALLWAVAVIAVEYYLTGMHDDAQDAKAGIIAGVGAALIMVRRIFEE